MAMLYAHVFGKEGCSKCEALKRRLSDLLKKEPYSGKIEVVWHDCLTEEGAVEFMQCNLNPSKIPALVMGGWKGYYLYEWDRDRLDKDKSLVGGRMAICTDYSDQHKGVITPAMIEELVSIGLNRI